MLTPAAPHCEAEPLLTNLKQPGCQQGIATQRRCPYPASKVDDCCVAGSARHAAQARIGAAHYCAIPQGQANAQAQQAQRCKLCWRRPPPLYHYDPYSHEGGDDCPAQPKPERSRGTPLDCLLLRMMSMCLDTTGLLNNRSSISQGIEVLSN